MAATFGDFNRDLGNVGAAAHRLMDTIDSDPDIKAQELLENTNPFDMDAYTVMESLFHWADEFAKEVATKFR